MRFARHLDPIVAIATAAGRGAIGVLRVSGSPLESLIAAVCGAEPAPRRAAYLTFRDAAGLPIDRGIAIHYPAPHSYTGEHVLELQAHGGPVVLQMLLARCLEAAAEIDPASGVPRLPDLRLAQPGEFTERAFLNGKIDLAQAEAVADLIDARTEAAARAAGRSLSGAFAEGARALVEEVVSLRVLVESTLDFPDEELDFLERADAAGRLERIAAWLDEITRRAAQGALLRDGIRVVLAGPPNVGKSSLLNALAGDAVAIVTPIPGTTRDRISETIQIEGVPVQVTDTAGLRTAGETRDEVERIGIDRSWEAIGSADVVLLLHDLTRPLEEDASSTDLAVRAKAGNDRVIEVFNKADAAEPAALVFACRRPGAIAISALRGDGIAELRASLLRRAGFDADMEGVFAARGRHLAALEEAARHVALALKHAAFGDASLELLAEELRLVQQALGAVTGEFCADDLLGAIFERFCIGK